MPQPGVADGLVWLLFATPPAVAAIGAVVYFVAIRQDRTGRQHGR